MSHEAPDEVFLDASIVMYAAGEAHPLRAPCRRALERAAAAGTVLVTSAEVLQEVLHRYFALKRPDAAETVHAATIHLCRRILPITVGHTTRALELLLADPKLGARDALHAATMEAEGLRFILSTDRDFDRIDGVERTAPEEFLT